MLERFDREWTFANGSSVSFARGGGDYVGIYTTPDGEPFGSLLMGDPARQFVIDCARALAEAEDAEWMALDEPT
jgi:hypothetical protein